MNTLEVDFKSGIRLFVSDPSDWFIAERLTGSAKSESPGVFHYALSALNLQRIYSTFRDHKRPQVVKGEWLVDRLRTEHANYNRYCAAAEQVCAQERIPIEPNGKFIPYAHQTKIMGMTEANPFGPAGADCGLGKTGSYARAVELAIAKGAITKGKILVSAPLSILETSWADDIKKFTNLNAAVLWTSITNKDILGEEETIHDYGEKPADALSVRTAKRTLYRNPTGRVIDKVTTLDKPSGPWTRFKANVKVATNANGEKTPFGPVKARVAVKEETKKLRLLELLADPSYDMFLINHDGVKIYEDELKAHGFEWIVVDESTKIKSPSSQVWKSHVDISWKCKRRSILSGTLNPNGFMDLWAQFYFLDRGLTLEGSMKDFLSEYFMPLKVGHFGGKDAFKWVLRSEQDTKRLVARVRRTGIFIKQRDCIDLPPRTDMRRIIHLTGEQERAYLEMEEELITEFHDNNIGQNIRAEAVNVLSKMMKLRQITAGYLAGEEGKLGKFAINPKLEDLDGFIEELQGEKLVIACQFKEEIQTVLERYRDLGIASIEGDVLVKKRNESIRDFQSTDNLQIIVLQPQAAAHGITLTTASRLLFLSLDYNFEYYYQTAKRIERIGQTKNIFVIHSLAALSDGSPTIDHDLIDILGTKAQDREALFSEARDIPEVASQLLNRMVQRHENRV